MANANELKPTSNPFHVNKVVDTLFDYLNLKDIISQRRVCKLWQKIGLTRLKNDINLIRISFHPDKPIDKFLEMSKSFSFEFTNFSFTYWNDGSDNYADPCSIQHTQRIIVRLFDEYGTHMKLITLYLFGSTNNWKFLSDVLLNKAPNLERLCLKSEKGETADIRLFSGIMRPELKLKRLMLISENKAYGPLYSQTLLTDLFASSPCLESLTVGFSSGDAIVVALQILADKGNISNLKELILRVGENRIFETLATSFKSAPLETFSIMIYRMNWPMLAYIEIFLRDHKHTLKNLYLAFPCVQFHKKLLFPAMNNLKVLSMEYWCRCDRKEPHRVPFRTLGVCDVGKKFPNLLTLCLFEVSRTAESRFFSLYEMFTEKTTPLLTVKNLRLPPISDTEILRRLGRIFPNVLKLDLVPQTPDVLRKLWTTWPEIQTLQITIAQHPSYRFSTVDAIFKGGIACYRSRRFASISNLKKLRHLKIDGYSFIAGNMNETYLKIQNETANSALAEMKDLVFLHVSRNRHEISPSVVQHLCKELNLLETEKERKVGILRLVKYEWQKQSWRPTMLDYK